MPISGRTTWKRWCFSAVTALGTLALALGAGQQLLAQTGLVRPISHTSCARCGQGLCRCGNCRCNACATEWHNGRPPHMQPHAVPSAPNYLPGTAPGTTPIPPSTNTPPATTSPDTTPNIPDTPTAPPVNTDNFFPGANNAPAAPLAGGLATSLASASTDGPAIPNMIGDFFGSSGTGTSVLPGGSSTTTVPVNVQILNLVDDFQGPLFSGASELRFIADPGTVFNVAANNVGLNSSNVAAAFTDLFATNPNSPVSPTTGEVLNISSYNSAPAGFTFGSGTLAFDFPTNADVILLATVNNANGQAGEIFIVTPNPGTSGVVVGRQKIAENTSPLPRDRVYMNYSYFDNVPLAIGGVNVNRFSPGFEKTFWDGNMSFEMRFPFASTLNSDIMVQGPTSDDEIEFGNITMYLKALLYADEQYAISGGLGIAVPTADDITANTRSGTRVLEVENEAVHLLPFLGGLWTPNDDFFVQGFVQFDFDANGNPVHLNQGNGLQRIGTANDTSFMFIDVGAGYFAWRAEDANSRLQSIIPTVELHYNRSLQKTDVVQSGPFRVGSFADDIQILNSVFGVTAQFNNDISATAAYVAPIGNSSDQQFDGEFRLLLNWYFGNSSATDRFSLSNLLQ